jgi:hypothetical protein
MYFLIVFFIATSMSIGDANAQQQSLGTSFGMNGSSPAVLWPRSANIESLGRLYPNGPEFGLSNTSGGFGMIGSGPISAVGSTTRSVSNLVREELERPYNYLQRLTDIFKTEAERNYSLLGIVLGSRFTVELQRGAASSTFDINTMRNLITPTSLPSVDAILKDGPSNPDTILHTGL